MARMGHDSPHAALIYQHATSEADRAIAQALHEAMHVGQRLANNAVIGKGEGSDDAANARG